MTQARIIAVALATLMGLGAAGAQAHEARGAGHDRMPDFADLDTDGSGTVSPAELSARAEARFAAADTDGDGTLTPAEMQAAAAARRAERIARMIARRDTDGDGAVSFEEMTAGRDPQRIFDRLDADADGAISEQEFSEMRAHRGQRGARHGEHRHAPRRD